MNEERKLTKEEILSRVDHTLLSPTATWDEVKALCDEGITYGTASVCIPPCFVREAREYVGKRLKICTVIGFPNGYGTSGVKAFETAAALNDGADEIDMVIPIGRVKEGHYDMVLQEIRDIKAVCGSHVLKVIVETCLLTEEEKIHLCRIVTDAGADYIKTSTGFFTSGATFDDVILFAENVGPGVKIKAAGGISSIEDAEKFIRLGADRLGTSRIVKLVKEEG